MSLCNHLLFYIRSRVFNYVLWWSDGETWVGVLNKGVEFCVSECSCRVVIWNIWRYLVSMNQCKAFINVAHSKIPVIDIWKKYYNVASGCCTSLWWA